MEYWTVSVHYLWESLLAWPNPSPAFWRCSTSFRPAAPALCMSSRRPLAITYRDTKDRITERVLEPYGVVALRGRWYATGLDSRSGQVRSFRLDRVAHAVVQEGQFSVPGGFDPAAQVVEAVSGASYRHAVSVRVQGSERAVRMRMPGSIATIEPVIGEPGWVRLRWRAQRLDWIPSVIAGLDRPFVIEEPDELRARVRALAEQLASWAEARVTGELSPS